MDSIEGSLIEKRIEILAQKKKAGIQEATQLYKPREGGVNKNAFRFTESQMSFIKKELDTILRFFNYEAEFGLEKTDGEDFRALNSQ